MMQGSKIGYGLLLLASLVLVACGGGNKNEGSIPALPLIDPPRIEAVNPGNGENTITWTSAGDAVKRYQLYYREEIQNVTGEYQSLNLINQTELAYVHSVTNGNQYTYKVSAINKEDKEGKQSVESSTVTPQGAPEKPVFTSAIATDSRVELEWNSKKGLTYDIEYKEAGRLMPIIKNVSTKFTQINTTGNTPLTNGIEYTYTLIAVNSLNNKSSSQPVTLTPLKVSNQVVTGLKATPGDYKVTLTWSRNPISLPTGDPYGILKYNVYRNEKDGVNSKKLTPQPIVATDFTDNSADLIPGTTYYYTVSQVNQNNIEGNKSTPVSAVPTEKLGTPRLILNVAPNLLKFNWDDVPGTDEYELLENNGAGYNPISPRIAATRAVNGNISVNLELSVHQYNFDTLYAIQTCKANVCGADGYSNEVSTTVNDIISAIGYFKASNNQPSAVFGGVVDISDDGNTLVVGAVGDSSAAKGINSLPTGLSSSSGAVYVFVKDTNISASTYGAWSQQAYLKASNADAEDRFGYSVSISSDGNTIAVSSHYEDSNKTGVLSVSDFTDDEQGLNSGAVYIFNRIGTKWKQEAYIKASNTRNAIWFGSSLSLSGDGNTLAVGSDGEDSITKGIIIGAFPPLILDSTQYAATNSGAVYIFTRKPTWSQTAYVKAFNSKKGMQFGNAIALNQDGTVLAVGAHLESNYATGVDITFQNIVNPIKTESPISGAVYTFTQNSGVWSKETYIKATNTRDGDMFGVSLALSNDGNVLVVGSATEDSASANPLIESDYTAIDSGAAYVLTRQSNQAIWSHNSYLKANNLGQDDRFGFSVAVSGDGSRIAVGALLEGSGSMGITTVSDEQVVSSGAVYLFNNNGTTWLPENFFIKSKFTKSRNKFGDSVTLTLDGKRLAVSAPSESSGTSGINKPPAGISDRSGAVYLY